MCSTEGLTETQLKPYKFEHCEGDIQVGKSYEVHFVHSAPLAEPTLVEFSDVVCVLTDGVMLTKTGDMPPLSAVYGLVFQLVNDDQYEFDTTKLVENFDSFIPQYRERMVSYQGSTTGGSFNNSVCSAYPISWHVHRGYANNTCLRMSAKSFDDMCNLLHTNFDIVKDIEDHGSRELVDEKYVVKTEYVTNPSEYMDKAAPKTKANAVQVAKMAATMLMAQVDR